MTFLLSTLIIVAILIFFNGLYVAGEFSTVAARKTRVSQQAAQGDRLARQLMPIIQNSRALDRYVAACQLGITVSSLMLGAFGERYVAERLVEPLTAAAHAVTPLLVQLNITTATAAEAAAHTVSITVILLLFTTLQVVLGELLPKSIAIQYPERVALATALPVKWSMYLFRPMIWLFNGSGNLLLRLIRVENGEVRTRAHSPAEIEILVTESHEGGLLDAEERQMLRNAFRLRDLTARQVMVHRTRIVAAPADKSVVELLELAVESGHTRLPLYQDDIDEIMGFVHIKDLFRLHVEGNDNLAQILREVVHVPETMPALSVWETLQDKRQYMAIVFDEYGGTAGLITLEDLIEEVFGEVQDEFDDEMAVMTFDQEGRRIHLRADLLVGDVNEYLDLSLPEDEANTLSGLVFHALGRPPEEGEEVSFDETSIRVERMEDLGVSEVSLQIGANEPVPRVEEWQPLQDEEANVHQEVEEVDDE
ncbi:MAG TPA: hemolysin family protein [Candidatus Sulfomarinibacteraceae bacterium]|nr:hemolysin family protein [Candidatus Sulfomarinibacteraceae bacterium]